MITCPSGTCDEKTLPLVPPPQIDDEVFQQDDDEVSPQEFQNDDDVFSPAVTPENYPLMFNLLKTPAIQTVPHADPAEQVIEQVEPVPLPPHPPDNQQG